MKPWEEKCERLKARMGNKNGANWEVGFNWLKFDYESIEAPYNYTSYNFAWSQYLLLALLL